MPIGNKVIIDIDYACEYNAVKDIKSSRQQAGNDHFAQGFGGFSVSRDALFSFCTVNRLIPKPFAVLAVASAIAVCFLSGAISLEAADYQTPNFIIRNAPDIVLAKQFGEEAEQLRKTMAVLWLGKELPRWSAPCPVFVKVGNYSAGGETSMDFNHGEVYGWNMQIQGSADAILTAVLPHEITHMILASHFRQPSPRWFDEGAATLVENEKERQNYRRLLYQYLRTERGIAFNRMFHMGEYPDDQMPLYAQGFSLAEFLIMQQGHRHYVDFAASGMKTENWPQAMRDYYGYANLGELQTKWNYWVNAGCPDLNQIPHDQPIMVSNTTQYIPSRDFMPTWRPMILAGGTRPSGDVIPASWESGQVAPVVAQNRQPEREPIRMALPEVPQNQTLAASTTQTAETRLPSWFLANPPEPSRQNSGMVTNPGITNQQPYQSSRSPQPPLPRENVTRVSEWSIR